MLYEENKGLDWFLWWHCRHPVWLLFVFVGYRDWNKENQTTHCDWSKWDWSFEGTCWPINKSLRLTASYTAAKKWACCRGRIDRHYNTVTWYFRDASTRNIILVRKHWILLFLHGIYIILNRVTIHTHITFQKLKPSDPRSRMSSNEIIQVMISKGCSLSCY
jgi:hypothetical protein